MRSSNENDLLIRQFDGLDEAAVIDLWQRCDLLRAWNNPKKDIARKMQINPELFLLGLIEERIVASVMGGYEGHRGWINYLAVDPDYRHRGLARQITAAVEEKIISMGCPKINLQIRADNLQAIRFYESIGYKKDAVVSMGKRLIEDKPIEK